MPRSGPTTRQIVADSVSRGGDTFVIKLNPSVARASQQNTNEGFSAAFRNAGRVAINRINPGDSLSVTVWENVDNGLLAEAGRKVTTLSNIEVDQDGHIFVPYAGRIRAAGMTPEQLRMVITDLLKDQTPDPQIEVRRAAGDGATISIIGNVGAQGVYPLQASNRSLTAMLAQAGGTSSDPEETLVTVRRGNQSGTVRLKEVMSDPAANIELRPGDVITLRLDERFFNVLGSARQGRVRFNQANLDIIAAIAQMGGLNRSRSNPRSVFVLRQETAQIASRIIPDRTFSEPQQIVYVVDLTDESALFYARNFYLRDEDTVYVTEAPYVEWTNIVNDIFKITRTIIAIDDLVQDIESISE